MKRIDEAPKGNLALSPINYVLIGIGLLLIVVGFALMSGGGYDDPKLFDPSIFSVRRITIAPIVLVIGFFFEIFAIMIKAETVTKYLNKFKQTDSYDGN